jgi:glycosyltransferase involved in cell wall biosynthesis
MINEKLVVFLLPLYNSELSDLSQTLRSIECQSYNCIKCIIVDDSPCKETDAYIKQFDNMRDKFIYIANNERVGLPGSLNIAINKLLPIADYFARIDSGDVCYNERILQQLLFLEDNPNISILGSAIQTTTDGVSIENTITFPENNTKIKRAFFYMNAIAHPTVMIRSDVFRKIGMYDEKFNFSEDLELWLRLSRRGVVFHNLQTPLVIYRARHSKRTWNNYLFNFRARVKNSDGSYLNYVSCVIPIISIFIPKMIFVIVYRYIKGF